VLCKTLQQYASLLAHIQPLLQKQHQDWSNFLASCINKRAGEVQKKNWTRRLGEKTEKNEQGQVEPLCGVKKP
jgi:hypothetical protein